jgi:hypothetical protein
MTLFRKHVYTYTPHLHGISGKRYLRTDYLVLGICVFRIEEEIKGIYA